ncbi:hypothetical protein LTR28_011900, partial [Elasticomyces elasticus]
MGAWRTIIVLMSRVTGRPLTADGQNLTRNLPPPALHSALRPPSSIQLPRILLHPNKRLHLLYGLRGYRSVCRA